MRLIDLSVAGARIEHGELLRPGSARRIRATWLLILTMSTGRESRKGKEKSVDAIEAILSRRSIRRYTPQPVPEAAIRQLLEAAMSAPSAGNEQPWQFVVITDRRILDEIPRFHPSGWESIRRKAGSRGFESCWASRTISFPSAWFPSVIRPNRFPAQSGTRRHGCTRTGGERRLNGGTCGRSYETLNAGRAWTTLAVEFTVC